ncbi:polysaccharide deacetylase family protein [Deinococcus metallilatus]|uniref:Peptidoglycan/xylan/chitin deacetylase (PgdA/CDA1 family) n=1 Tax=Deinococcus metallilatus TaxID=1211322 RepID=A0AAJ5F9F7_9DEIO|nr:polysaccharide deacetylase family protein [Deinococcus metallilatus]MBB5294989.1 peptidoglycan/xylan/chitin deacetylase (PgdA/CDA1 family) [Deinococcus metallilatus]QBY09318.1 polysaccharide deacetylase family protein [Deinococcus metallilatus]RXJ09323.1 polysaccharide deacetylase family protein [Deinococcus metallilatus]TLK28845.1 polysaccharide deacetylase family protein [Deinococcus metallilatus]GMA16921.1 polysaccharide deacetylase familiy protein [Deinococcus metallilatus]
MRRILLLSAAMLLSTAAAQPPAPVPPVTPPGQVQPLAPGTRAAPTLPTLTLTPAIPGVRKVEVLGNGFIEVAHALVLLPAGEVSPQRALALAVQSVQGAYRADPQLAEVDVSMYRAETYRGLGGPLPVLTLSVPRARLRTFQSELTADTYDRLWTPENMELPEPPGTPAHEPERLPVFVGTPAELQKQRLEQSLAQARGGVRGGLLFKGNPTGRQVALTFDDVPHPLYFPLVLDLLRREQARATFFIIGRNAEAYPYFIRDMVQAGHEFGNHTYHHVRLPHLTDAQIRAELQSTNELLTRLTGEPVRFFRPPGGEYSERVLNIARSLGLTTVFWTDDPGDFQNPGVETVEARFARHLRPGGIILLHDNAPDGLAALPDLLKAAREKGYRAVPAGAFVR